MSEIVLVVGGGGREHAIAKKQSQSVKVSEVIVAPGNGGTAVAGGKIRNHPLALEGVGYIEAIVTFAKEKKVSLVIVGPEQPLVDGLSDALKAVNIPCFGPSAAAAQIEASKAFSKDFMKKYRIPTAEYCNFTDIDKATEYLQSIKHRVVVKASGLAAGKGVFLPETTVEAIENVKQLMSENAFGEAGTEIVIEEFLEGFEVSVLAFCDGKKAECMVGAQDHKRIFDGKGWGWSWG